MKPEERERCGRLLFEEGLITREELQEAIAEAGIQGTWLATLLDEAHFPGEMDLVEFLASPYEVPHVDDLLRLKLDPEAVRLVSEDLARKHELVPVAKIGAILCVAKSNYYNRAAVRDLRHATGLKVKVLHAEGGQVQAALERAYRGEGNPDQTSPPEVSAHTDKGVPEDLPLISPPDFEEVSRRDPSSAMEINVTAVAEESSLKICEPSEVNPESHLDKRDGILDAISVDRTEWLRAKRTVGLLLTQQWEDIYASPKPITPFRID